MNSFPLLLATLLVVCASFLAAVRGDHGGCFKDFKNNKEMMAAMAKCKTSLSLTDADFKAMHDKAKTPDYDDKCFMKCVMTEGKLMKDDGSVDMKALEEDFKKNAPDGKAEALIALMNECAETTSKDATVSKDICKAIAKTKMCFMMGQDKICPSKA